MGTQKVYISANELFRDSFELAQSVYASGYRPDVLLVMWRGGTPVGITIHEYLEYKGVVTLHAAVKATSYTGIGERVAPRVEHAGSVLDAIPKGASVLLVDDIFDSGRTVEKMIELLSAKTPNVKVATLYWKRESNETALQPDFFLCLVVHKSILADLNSWLDRF